MAVRVFISPAGPSFFFWLHHVAALEEKSPFFKMLPEKVQDWYFEEPLGVMGDWDLIDVFLRWGEL